MADDKEVEEKEDDKEVEEKEDETKKGFAAIKSAGRAGAISLFLWEAAFWIIAGEFYILGCVVLLLVFVFETKERSLHNQCAS